MYDKTVRRRRLVLGLLVASSLILLTVYFGESTGGGLHAVQRGAVTIVSPVQDIASRALKPARDFFGWFGDTLHAKGDLEKVREDRDELREQLVATELAIRDVNQRAAVGRMLQRAELDDQVQRISARLITYNASLWYSQIQIDKGTGDGVRVGQAVVAGAGLVGTVSAVTSGSAIVRLITDHQSYASALVAESGIRGGIEPQAGSPGELVLSFVHPRDTVEEEQTVVTCGCVGGDRDGGSLFPRGIPIGTVTKVDDPGTDEQTIHVRPFVQFRRIDTVEVLATSGEGAS